jgi:DHA1 family tetracycline resistance protein-like MFS transporter
MSDSTATVPRRRAAEFVILGTVFLDVISIGIIVPVFPALVTSISGFGPGKVAELFAMFSAVFGVMQFVGSPILGAASDQFGRRPIIILSNLVSGLQFVLMALAPSIAWLLVARIISGLATGSMPAANAWVADMVPQHRRAASFGYLGAAMGLGFAIGPGIGGLLGSVDPRAPFWAAAVFCVLNGLFGIFVLKESLPRSRRTRFHMRHTIPLGTIVTIVRRYPALGSMLTVQLFIFLASFAIQTIGVLYTGERYGWGSGANGLMLMGFGGFSTLVQVAIVQPMIKLIGQRRALLTGLAFQVAGLVIFGLATTGTGFWMGVPVMCMGALSGPIWTSMMTEVVDPTEQGKLSGVTSSLMSLVSIGAPFIYASVFAATIRNPHMIGGAGAPFFLGAIVMTLAVGLAAIITARLPQPRVVTNEVV